MTTIEPNLRLRTKRFVKRALRTTFEPGSRLERRLRDLRRPESLQRDVRDGYTLRSANRVLVIEPDGATDTRGIQLFGGCDQPTLFALGPILGPEARTRFVVQHEWALAMSRADVILQTLDPPKGRAARETVTRMNLPGSYFRPVVFEPEMSVHAGRIGAVRKAVVVLTGGANAIRPAYRHKTMGFIVDPGGWWLRNRAKLTAEELDWFRTNFESIGRLPLDQFVDDYTRVVKEIKARTGAEVLVLNSLTVEPGTREHNYQLRRTPEGLRRIEFHIALSELADRAGFHLVDVDDVLKRAGVREQVDFNHYPASAYEPIATEAAAVLREIGVR